MSDTPEADALEEADRYKVAQIAYYIPPYDRMYELAQELERERDQARREAEDLRDSMVRPEWAKPIRFSWESSEENTKDRG